MKKIREFLGDFSMAGARRFDAPGNIRYSQNVLGSRNNVLSDEQQETQPPSAAIVLLSGKNKKFLAVSRSPGTFDMNLPGGGIESGESPEDAARREVWEETGLIVHDLVPIYTGENSSGKLVTVFRALSASGKLKSSDEGDARWVTKQDLLSSTYGDFFSKILEKVAL